MKLLGKLSCQWACIVALMLGTIVPDTMAFQVSLPKPITSKHRTSAAEIPTERRNQILLRNQKSGGGGFGPESQKSSSSKFSSSSASSPSGDFAYQEMLVFLNTMQREGVSSKTMDPAKRSELEGYVRKVLAQRSEQSIPLRDIGQAIVPKSSWKLMFSTSNAVLESLPQDATVFLNILDQENLDYILQFSKKTLGLDSLTAKCKYTFDAGPVQPGLLTFVYDKVTTNVLGFQNVGVGLFGLLKGRANYVESAYFDGTFWIERGVAPSGDGDFVNVYMRVDE